MLTSKQIIELTEISRATLNNYIALGLVQKPLVQRTKDDDGRAPRIGYFPDEALDRIKQVQQLKKEGLSMSAITDRFNNKKEPDSVTPFPEQQFGEKKENDSKRLLTVELGIEDIPGPAYMVNNNFEVVWWNDAAVEQLFGQENSMQGDIEERNIFRLLMESSIARQMVEWQEILSNHLETAKKRLSRKNIASIYSSLTPDDARILDELYESAEALDEVPVVHYPVNLNKASEEITPHNLYACFFREGILFAYAKSELDCSPLLELLSRRDHVIRNLLKKRKPFLTQLAVMVADLQNSVQICAELPPDEYFELINHIWQAAEPIFRKYYGTHGKHVGDGMVYYFFPQPDSNYILNSIRCAHDLKNMMCEISREWQTRKNWLHSLYLNTGLHEGQEWFGTYHSGTNLEFTVLGDTINHAARISDLARQGSIWSTKNMLGNLTSKERNQLRFGIRRSTDTGEEILVKDIYSRISSIVDLNEGRNYKFNDIAMLPVTEIVDIEQPK
jgi:adenylate cyclase